MEKRRKYPEKLRDKEELFYLISEGDGTWFVNVWFVNNTDEILTKVESISGGCATVDDDVIMMRNASDAMVYEEVMPREAVLIDRFDRMYDSDFLMEFGVDIVAPSIGNKSFKSNAVKGESSDATLLWTPLPLDTCDPENPNKLLAPKKAASDYMEKTGNYLDKSIFLNRGDLTMDYAAKRLAPSGVVLEKFYHRNGRITEYLVTDAERTAIFRTCDFEKACVFVESLRKNS